MITRARLKELRSLATRQGRRQHGAFLAEGCRVLEEALRHGSVPRLVLYCEDWLRARDRALLDRLQGEAVTLESVPARDLERVADAQAPQAVLGEMPLPDAALPQERSPDLPRVLVLDGVQDPGNVGTLLRSALAFGVHQVALTGASADPFGPKVVRASAGALFALTVMQEPSPAVLRDWLVLQELPLLVAAVRSTGEGAALQALLEGPRLALAIGSEAEGCDPVLERAAALCWRIPHEKAVESLNAGVAGSILLQMAYAAARGGGDMS